MFNFNIDIFLIDKRLGILELSKKISVPFQSLYYAKKNQKISPKLLRKLEEKFGDCSNYIIKEEENQVA